MRAIIFFMRINQIFRYYQFYTEMGGDEDEGGCTAGCCGEIGYGCGDYDSDEDDSEGVEVGGGGGREREHTFVFR